MGTSWLTWTPSWEQILEAVEDTGQSQRTPWSSLPVTTGPIGPLLIPSDGAMQPTETFEDRRQISMRVGIACPCSCDGQDGYSRARQAMRPSAWSTGLRRVGRLPALRRQRKPARTASTFCRFSRAMYWTLHYERRPSIIQWTACSPFEVAAGSTSRAGGVGASRRQDASNR